MAQFKGTIEVSEDDYRKTRDAYLAMLDALKEIAAWDDDTGTCPFMKKVRAAIKLAEGED